MKRSWPATILAFVMALIGIVLAIGGAWLLILGGSPYYLIAGLALLASGWFLSRVGCSAAGSTSACSSSARSGASPNPAATRGR